MTKQQEQAPASAPTSLGRLLRMKDVERETSLHRATIYRGIKAGTFPAPRMIGAHGVCMAGSRYRGMEGQPSSPQYLTTTYPQRTQPRGTIGGITIHSVSF